MSDGSVIIDTLLNNEGFKKGLGSLGKIAKAGLIGVTAAIGSVTTAFGGIVVESVKARGELEQQIGGVETLFKNSANKVVENANKAYKTAGMSANAYMQNVTSFSASLLQSVAGDTEKAANIADMAMVDMSDNANKMGTSMEAITNAYQGFAKQNYTMLDNLKLGYGGTKTEMERLLADAQKLTGIKYDISNLSDVYEAIHVIQGKLGITGTTAKEATETLQGSLASLSASWQNFLSGSGDLGQVVESATNTVSNIVRIVDEALPQIMQSISTAMPQLIELGSKVLNSFVTGLMKYLPQLLKTAGQILSTLGQGILQVLPELVPIALQIIEDFAAGLINALPEIFETGKKILQELTKGIIEAIAESEPFQIFIEKLTEVKNWIDENSNVLTILAGVIGTLTAAIIAYNIANNIMTIGIGVLNGVLGLFSTMTTIATAVSTAFGAVMAFITSPVTLVVLAIGALITIIVLLVKNWDTVKEKALEVWEKIKTGLSETIDKIIEWFSNLPYTIGYYIGLLLGKIIQFGIDTKNWVKTKVPEIINGIIDFFKELPEKIWTWLTKTITKFSDFLKDMKDKAKDGVKKVGENIYNGFTSLPEKVSEAGKNIVEGLWNGINNAGTWIKDKVKEFASGILDGMKSALGIHSPSTVFRDEVGKFIALGIGEGFSKNLKNVYSKMQNAVDVENSKLSSNLTANTTSNITRNANITATLDEINTDKEIVVNAITNLDGKVLTRTTNRVEARQRLQYGLA